jgi:outer membrane receptor protein involved in Fe transport
LAGSVGLSVTDWRHIQADLVDRTGFPFTTNLGNSHIRGVEASVDWVVLPGLRLDAAMFLNDTRVSDPDPALRRQVGTRLPNTPPFAASGSIGYAWALGGEARMSVDGGWRYVGRSTVGTQAPLDVSQGDYGAAQLGATWAKGRVRLTGTIDNVFDVRGDRFAGGNPFALAARNEYTPLRPRTLRLGGAVAW